MWPKSWDWNNFIKNKKSYKILSLTGPILKVEIEKKIKSIKIEKLHIKKIKKQLQSAIPR
jgi:hypothetical protein